MKTHLKKIFISIICLTTAISFGQNIEDLDKRAEEFYIQKKYNMAIKLWLDAIEIDPTNEKIQKKIEIIYGIKQRKDLAIQRSKLNYKIARKYLRKDFTEEDFKIGEKAATKSIKNYIKAFRLDPKDPELRSLLEDMKKLEADLASAKEKQRLTRALLAKIKRLKNEAKLLMEPVKKEIKPDYKAALKVWEEVLDLAPKDKEAKEGKRKCTLAIENRIKFEKIRRFMANGKELYNKRQYAKSRIEFSQVIRIDEQNEDAKDFIEKIDDKLAEAKLRLRKRQQAEDFYQSGLINIKKYNFSQAEEDLESALALIKNYKDAKRWLANLGRLKKEYEQRKLRERLKMINKEFQDGVIALSDGRYKDAVTAFSRTLNLDPGNELAKNYLKRSQDALKKQAEEVVDQNSPYYNIIASLIIAGKSLYKKGKYIESRKKWDRILQLFPKNRIATQYILRCELALNPDRFEEFAKRFINEARDLMKKKKYKEALRKLNLIKSIKKNYPEIEKLIARVKYFDRQQAGGGNLNAATRAEINRRYNLAINFVRRGGKANYTRALGELQWIVQRDPNNTKAAIMFNKVRTQVPGNIQVAQKRRLNPAQRRLVRVYYNRGINYYLNNNFKNAIIQWRKVLAIDPGNVKAKNNIRKVIGLLNR